MKNSNATLAALGTLILGFAGGFAFNSLERKPSADAPVTSGDPSSELATTQDQASVVVPDSKRVAANKTDSSPNSQREEATQEQTAETELFHAALRAYAKGQIQAGWRSERADEIPGEQLTKALRLYEETLLSVPRRLGIQLAEQRNEAEQQMRDAARGGALNLLAARESEGGPPLPALVGDAAKFGALFQTEAKGRQRSIRQIGKKMGQDLVNGDVVQFPEGVYKLDSLDRLKAFPEDITLAGTGRDLTLLIVSDLSTRSPIRNLSIRDCTVFTDNNSIVDLRTAPSTLQFERTRLIGFDYGAGCSCLFNTDGSAIYVRNSIIEGGYGRSQKSGDLFDIRNDAHLVRFEGCILRHLSLGCSNWYSGATVAFVDCSLEQLFDHPTSWSSCANNSTLVNTTTTYWDKDQEVSGQDPSYKKDLNDLFPDWKKRMETY